MSLALENLDIVDLMAAQSAISDKISELEKANKAAAKAAKAAEVAAAKAAVRAAKLAERNATKMTARAQLAAIRLETGSTVGRPENTGTFDNKWGIVEGLKLIAAKDGFYHYNDVGAAVSRVLTLQLVARGLVETHKAKLIEGPGRAKLFYRLTGKGRGYMALSARWKQPE